MSTYYINTNKRYCALFYDNSHIIIEFTDDRDDESYFGYESYICWTIGEDGDYDKKAILNISKTSYDCFIITFEDEDTDVSIKELVKDLITEEDFIKQNSALLQYKNPNSIDDEC